MKRLSSHAIGLVRRNVLLSVELEQMFHNIDAAADARVMQKQAVSARLVSAISEVNDCYLVWRNKQVGAILHVPERIPFFIAKRNEPVEVAVRASARQFELPLCAMSGGIRVRTAFSQADPGSALASRHHHRSNGKQPARPTAQPLEPLASRFERDPGQKKREAATEQKEPFVWVLFFVAPFSRQNEATEQQEMSVWLLICGSSLYLPGRGAILYLPKSAPINAIEQHDTSRNARVFNLIAGSPRSAALRWPEHGER